MHPYTFKNGCHSVSRWKQYMYWVYATGCFFGGERWCGWTKHKVHQAQSPPIAESEKETKLVPSLPLCSQLGQTEWGGGEHQVLPVLSLTKVVEIAVSSPVSNAYGQNLIMRGCLYSR